MPSASLLHWQNDRMPRLAAFETQCAASLAAVPSNPQLIDENLRGYVVLLSAHFQGFSRDLYTEAALIVISKVRANLRPLFETQFFAHCALDQGNPHLHNLKKDFDRFGFKLDLGSNPANLPRLQDLALLSAWRNVAAHQGRTAPAGGPLTLAALQAWRVSCDGLATSLDGVMYNQLRRVLRRKPW